MKQRIPVGSKVRATAKYASECDDLSYINSVGELMKDDGTGTPYRVVYEDQNEFHWFRESELELVEEPVDEQSLTSIELTVLKLMDGKVLYTQNGTKVYLDKGIFKFGKVILNLEKLVDVPLYTEHNPKPAFDIDVKRGTHCQVWNTEEGKDSNIYRLIYKYVHSDTHKFKSLEGAGWKNAVPVK